MKDEQYTWQIKGQISTKSQEQVQRPDLCEDVSVYRTVFPPNSEQLREGIKCNTMGNY